MEMTIEGRNQILHADNEPWLVLRRSHRSLRLWTFVIYPPSPPPLLSLLPLPAPNKCVIPANPASLSCQKVVRRWSEPDVTLTSLPDHQISVLFTTPCKILCGRNRQKLDWRMAPLTNTLLGIPTGLLSHVSFMGDERKRDLGQRTLGERQCFYFSFLSFLFFGGGGV